MTEKSKGSQKSTQVAPPKIPPIIAKPGGEQPGTRAFIQKADTKKK